MNTKRYRLLIAISILLVLLLAGVWSCHRSKTSEESREIADLAALDQGDDALFNAIDNLNGMEEFNSTDAIGEILARFFAEKPPKGDEPIDPVLAAWPQPETFRQAVYQVRQWLRVQPPTTDWKLDPMMAALPKSLGELPQVKNLGEMDFTPFDGFALQEAAWLRDVSSSTRGDAVEALDRVRDLFDWIVRNIQLEPDRSNRIPQFPRETLLFGRGTATERAWVFILLLRQLDIDAAILAIDQPQGERGEGRGERGEKDKAKENTVKSVRDNAPGPRAASAMDAAILHPWCIGVLIGKKVYLFDPLLGLPIPGPDGVTLDESGQLAIRPATLAEVAADPKLLRRLDIDASQPYGVKAVDPRRVVALLEASPPYLSRPMMLIGSRLIGERKMFLTTSPSAAAERWKAAHVAKSHLWLQPFETLWRRSHLDWRASALWLRDVLPLFWVYQEQTVGGGKTSMDPLEYNEAKQAKAPQVLTHAAALYKGRVLYFKGKFGEEGAAGCYRTARPSYQSLRLSSETDLEKQVKVWARQDASYWFGLMAYQRGRYRSAIDWLQAKTIEADPDGPWSTGARYNLARAYEASNQPELAMLLYHSNPSSPGYAGDLLRAKWLKELGEKRKPAGE
ncbi:MAG: hypothetical protein WCB27_04380 [Thermoguttaceae bacterium]